MYLFPIDIEHISTRRATYVVQNVSENCSGLVASLWVVADVPKVSEFDNVGAAGLTFDIRVHHHCVAPLRFIWQNCLFLFNFYILRGFGIRLDSSSFFYIREM